MQEYEDLGHMNQNNEDARCTEERYYLKRHMVYKSSNSTHTVVLWMAHVLRIRDSEWYANSRTYSTTIFEFHRVNDSEHNNVHSPQI